jgi:putative transcriptional regulator
MENGSRIIQGAKEALAIASDEMDPSAYAVHVPETVGVRGIREKLQMTQADFARTFGFKLATLRHWEQKSRVPEVVLSLQFSMVRAWTYPNMGHGVCMTTSAEMKLADSMR